MIAGGMGRRLNFGSAARSWMEVFQSCGGTWARRILIFAGSRQKRWRRTARRVAPMPADARLIYERDQLRKRLGEKPEKRLRELERRRDSVQQRDDLSVELSALYNQTGQYEKAASVLAGRQFQPWEGGEGAALGQHVRAQLALGRAAFVGKDFNKALCHFEKALGAPRNLGEAKHLLANQSDIYYWLGCAAGELGQPEKAREWWSRAANFKGDFQEMSVRTFSEDDVLLRIGLGEIGTARQSQKAFQ